MIKLKKLVYCVLILVLLSQSIASFAAQDIFYDILTSDDALYEQDFDNDGDIPLEEYQPMLEEYEPDSEYVPQEDEQDVYINVDESATLSVAVDSSPSVAMDIDWTVIPPKTFDTAFDLPLDGMFHFPLTGSELQTALDNANPGDVIVLEAGVTYVGNFILPYKPYDRGQWIYIVSSEFMHLPEGVRVTLDDLVHMPRLVAPLPPNAPAGPATIQAMSRANHYRFVGIEIASDWDQRSSTVWNIVNLNVKGTDDSFPNWGWGTGPDYLDRITAADLPNNIIFDRVVIRGTPTGNIRRGINMDARYIAVIDSHISEIHEVGADNMTIGATGGPGPFMIINNFLESACMAIMFGGGDAPCETLMPSDITI